MEAAKFAGKINAGASRLRIIGLFLILFAFALFVYFTRKQEQHIEVQKSEITQKDAVIDENAETLEKVAVVQSRSDQLASIVKEYVDLRAKHDVDGLDKLYAERLDRYFKNLTNTSRDEIRRSDKQYWLKNPQDTYIMTGEPSITISSDGSAKAVLNGRNCRNPTSCTDQLVQINFDAENKINYVRGYLATG
jgi:hypothetical protein